MDDAEKKQAVVSTVDDAINRLIQVKTVIGGDAPFTILTHDVDGELDCEYEPVIDAIPGPDPKNPDGPPINTCVVSWRILFGIVEDTPPEPPKPKARHLSVVR